jgi:hypothetical protein
MAKRCGKRRDPGREKFWRRAIRDRQQSGLSVRDFCRREGLKDWTFRWWRQKPARRDRQPAAAPRGGGRGRFAQGANDPDPRGTPLSARAGDVRASGDRRGGVLRQAEGDGEGPGRSAEVGPNPMGPAVDPTDVTARWEDVGPVRKASIALAARRIALSTIMTGGRALDREPVRDRRATIRADPAACIPSTSSPYFGRGDSLEPVPNTIPPVVPDDVISERRLGLSRAIESGPPCPTSIGGELVCWP